jgi:hypothetical protein
MDAFQLIAEIVKAVAWPAVVLIVCLKLRDPLAELIPLMEELRYKDLVLKFRSGLAQARAEANPTKVIRARTVDSAANLATGVAAELLDAASAVPTGAVLQAWSALQAALIKKAVAIGALPADTDIRGNSRLGHILLHAGAISLDDFKLFHRLRELRNIAAHDADAKLSSADAVEYISLALPLIERASGNQDAG